MKKEQAYGECEISCISPKTISAIYKPKGETAKLVSLSKCNQEAYNREVEKPFFVDADGLTTLNGKPARRASIVLKAPGCSKRRANQTSKSYPNCPFCVFTENFSTGGNPVTADQYESQMKKAMAYLRSHDLDNIDIIEIYNSGSFFNETEIYKKARRKIIDVLRNETSKNITITVESKFSDLVSLKAVDEVLLWLNSDGGTRKLEIAFGLETTDPLFGEQMQKKTDQEVLAQMIKDLAEKGVRSFFYILIKPGLMSEEKAITTAAESIKQVALISKQLELPARLKPHLSLAPTRIYANSLLHAFKSYKSPKYWSVAKTLQLLGEDNVFDYVGLHIGLSGEGIPIIAGGSPKTGSKHCHDTLEKIFSEFNHDMDLKKFLQRYNALLKWDQKSCGCFEAWKKQLDKIPVETINSSNNVITQKQLNEVMVAEKAAWPVEVQATINKFESRFNVFPEGFLLGYESGVIAGVSTAEITNFDKRRNIRSWENITNDGFVLPIFKNGKIVSGHDPKGNSLYVVSLGVRKDFKGQGIGGALIEAQKDLVIKKNLKYLFLGSRIPCFAKAKKQNPKLSIEKFVKAKDEQGRLLDNDIRFYTSHGLKIYQIKTDYMEDDPESLNYGVVMYWENKQYKFLS